MCDCSSPTANSATHCPTKTGNKSVIWLSLWLEKISDLTKSVIWPNLWFDQIYVLTKLSDYFRSTDLWFVIDLSSVMCYISICWKTSALQIRRYHNGVFCSFLLDWRLCLIEHLPPNDMEMFQIGGSLAKRTITVAFVAFDERKDPLEWMCNVFA